MSCEDYPCCGHEAGCCPDYDESGRQTNMICTCGAVLPANNPVSICNSCLRHASEDDDPLYDDDDWDEEESDADRYDSMDGDWDSGMASAGWGTDEDYW